MKTIILAAGQGIRLRPLTDHYPKCMIKYKDKPIINHILDTFKYCGLNDFVIVTGYKNKVLSKHLEEYKINYVYNKDYRTTNMLHSLFLAEDKMNDDLIISYSDIIFNPIVVEKLINNKEEFVVIIDEKWRDLWQYRMDNPLDDAETLKIDSSRNIIEIGNKPISYDEIQGQYIGLFKISKSIINDVIAFYHSLNQKKYFNTQEKKSLYMTTFIQLIIDNLMTVKAEIIQGGWLEFDTRIDFEKMQHIGLDFKL